MQNFAFGPIACLALLGCSVPAPAVPGPDAPPGAPSPIRVYVDGSDILAFDQPVDWVPTTAVGGTQTISLSYDRAPNERVPLDVPFQVEVVGGTAAIEHIDGAKVTIRGVAAGESTLRITDGVAGAVWREVDLVSAVPTQAMLFAPTEALPEIARSRDLGPPVFLAGDQWLDVVLGDASIADGIALTGQLVDDGLRLHGPAGSTQDGPRLLYLPATALGVVDITATVGTVTLSTPVRLVATVDELTLVGDPAQSVVAPRRVCFRATSAGDVVRALPFTFDVAGGAATVDPVDPACPVIQAAPGATSVTIHAAAGGRTLTVTLPAV